MLRPICKSRCALTPPHAERFALIVRRPVSAFEELLETLALEVAPDVRGVLVRVGGEVDDLDEGSARGARQGTTMCAFAFPQVYKMVIGRQIPRKSHLGGSVQKLGRKTNHEEEPSSLTLWWDLGGSTRRQISDEHRTIAAALGREANERRAAPLTVTWLAAVRWL
jgi:hypothetical protein